MSSLADRLTALNTDLGDNNDSDWVLFIQDHFIPIRENADVMPISPERMYQFKYAPEQYMELIKRNKSLTWIMMLINQIDDASKFNELTSILIPNETYIQQLRDIFNNYMATLENASNEN